MLHRICRQVECRFSQLWHWGTSHPGDVGVVGLIIGGLSLGVALFSWYYPLQTTSDAKVTLISSEQFELLLWHTIESSSHADDFEAYLSVYRRGHFESLARSRLKSLETPAAPGAETIPRESMVASAAIPSMSKPIRSPDVSGTVTAVESAARIRVGERWVELYGISDPTSNKASHVQSIIRYLTPTRGVVECYQKADDKYQCYASDEDLALKAIQAHIARPLPDAPAAYSSSEPSAH